MKILGPLRAQKTSLYAADQAFGLVYAVGTLRGASSLRDVRGFFFPLRRKLVWIYVDYS